MKNENFKLVKTGLLILLGLSVLINVGNNVIPTRYQFNPEIWGTVSDWMIIFITLVTAVFLYKTLRSQQGTQELQANLLKIELQREKTRVMPVFSIKPRFEEKDMYFEIALNDNIAREVEFTFTFLHSLKVTTNEEINLKHDLLPGKTDFNICWHINEKPFDLSTVEVKILVSFQDIHGYKYEQKILTSSSSSYLGLPVEIN